MQNNIFIPKKIKIGFQKRDDTFTQKLAYVIYYDEKNKLRKEQSWNTWRDHNIPPIDIDNTPIPGFVLNKKVGGDKYDWNVRNTYVRIYDPRDFEFEITIPNLLFILENTNCIKGKGLEGTFVYGWACAELLLVPTSSPEFSELSKLNDLRHNKTHIKSKDLILGATYRHKSNTTMIYMGKFNKYQWERWGPSTGKLLGEYFYFIDEQIESDDNGPFKHDKIKTFKSINDYFIEVIDKNCASNYAKLMDDIEKCPIFSPIDESKTKYIEYATLAELKSKQRRYHYGLIILNNEEYQINFYDNKFNCFNNGRKSRIFDSVEQLFNEKPCYKNTYLTNGKLFESTK
jgi:hypothetical protein